MAAPLRRFRFLRGALGGQQPGHLGRRPAVPSCRDADAPSLLGDSLLLAKIGLASSPLDDVGNDRRRLVGQCPRLQRCGAHFSGIPVKGKNALRQKRFGKSKFCGERRGLDPGEPVARTMLHQDLAVLPCLQHLVVDQRVAVADVVNGAVDFAIKTP